MGSPRLTTSPKGSRLTKPTALKESHDCSDFDCGRDAINSWLHSRAMDAQESGTARVFVVCRGTKKVVAYYALAAGSVEHSVAPGQLKRNAPNPVPVLILARLGVTLQEQKIGLGHDLLSDAMKRSLQVTKLIGARAMLVHALDAKAAAFYEAHNFIPIDDKRETLYLPMKTIRAGI
jgi:predicted N-acetyltransferase YhbS